MAYSKTKPYNKVSYKGAADPSYDRYLKEAVNAGKAENIKESELEKPYNVKQTYGAMQQDYNFVLPPPYEWPELPGVLPGITIPVDDDDGIIPVGSGGLNCMWTNTGCEQLVGCWAGSDIVLDGPEAATAGYMPVSVEEGAIVKQTISGSEGRGIEIILDPTMPRDSFLVMFKDGLGEVHQERIEVTCSRPLVWTTYDTGLTALGGHIGAVLDSSNTLHIFCDNNTGARHITWDGISYTSEDLTGRCQSLCVIIDGADTISVIGENYDSDLDTYPIRRIYGTTGSWTYETIFNPADLGTIYGGISAFFDSSGYIHAVFSNSSYDSAVAENIYHVTNASGSWAGEVVTTVTGTREFIGSNAIIKSDDSIHILYVQQDYYPLTAKYYLKHIYGSWGSWSAIGTVKDNIGVQDYPRILKDSSENLHVLMVLSLNPTEYIYTGSWTETTILASTEYRYPVGVAVGNTLYCQYLKYIGDFYFTEFIKDGTWSAPETTGLPISGLNAWQFELYDSVRNALHLLYINTNLFHVIRYL